MSSVNLSVDPDRFEEIRRVMTHLPGGAEKAIARALNRAVSGARAAVIEEVRDRYTIHPNVLKGSMRIIKASPQRLVAAVVSRGPGLPVAKFKLSHVRIPKQKGIPSALRQKISSEIIPGQSKEWSHAFLARMKSGHLGLFTRHETELTSRGKPVIAERFSLAVPQMIGTNAILSEVMERAGVRLDRELDHQVRFLLGSASA